MLKEPNCSIRKCKHFQGTTPEPDERPRCAAFPNGIPDSIAYGDNLHLKPVRGDGGIQFELADGSDD